MTSFISRVVNRFRRRRIPIAGSDCSDLLRAVPDAPTFARLCQVVAERHAAALQGAPHTASGPSSSDARHADVSLLCRGVLFDLRHRCGAAGRCVDAPNGPSACRFPHCIALRPLTKGPELLAAREAFECGRPPTDAIASLVALAASDRLDAAVEGIARHAEELVAAAARGRPLVRALRPNSADGVQPAAVRFNAHNRRAEEDAPAVNPLRADAMVREAVVALYAWRAALLVNTRRDERAVDGLLNLVALLRPEAGGAWEGPPASGGAERTPAASRGNQTTHSHPMEDTPSRGKDGDGTEGAMAEARRRLVCAAASWAALNDMEVIYYRSLLQQCAPFPFAQHMAQERPLLLRRVFEALQNSTPEDLYLRQCAAHVVFSREVTAAVARAQSAQQHGDTTEDPLRSHCIPLALRYYRFCVHEDMWTHFLNLLCMPPAPDRADAEETRLGLTPSHVLDAVGRSMLLHHLLAMHEAREAEIASGAVVDDIKRAEGETPHPSRYERVLSGRDKAIAVARLRELLLIARGYEETVKVGGEDPNMRRVGGE